MNSYFRVASVVSMGVLSTGCAAESIDDQLSTPPELAPLAGGGNGSGDGTHNGLYPDIYHLHRVELEDALEHPLVVGGQLNPLMYNLISTPGGRQLFTDAVECAIPLGVSVGNFAGAGLMVTTGDWLNNGLPSSKRDDVQTCIATRFNPYGMVVPIWIGGPNTSKGTDGRKVEYFEALWSVRHVGNGGWEAYVWPANTFDDTPGCAGDHGAAKQEWTTRVCQNSTASCALNIRYDMATACTGTPGGGDWVCDGFPAIETRLDSNAWEQMHPICRLPTPP